MSISTSKYSSLWEVDAGSFAIHRAVKKLRRLYIANQYEEFSLGSVLTSLHVSEQYSKQIMNAVLRTHGMQRCAMPKDEESQKLVLVLLYKTNHILSSLRRSAGYHPARTQVP